MVSGEILPPDQAKLLHIIAIVCSFLSIIGGTFVVATVLILRKGHMYYWQQVAFLSLASLIASLTEVITEESERDLLN